MEGLAALGFLPQASTRALDGLWAVCLWQPTSFWDGEWLGAWEQHPDTSAPTTSEPGAAEFCP